MIVGIREKVRDGNQKKNTDQLIGDEIECIPVKLIQKIFLSSSCSYGVQAIQCLRNVREDWTTVYRLKPFQLSGGLQVIPSNVDDYYNQRHNCSQ